LRILHIDTGKEWRGGQRQAFFLHEGLINHGYESRMVCHSDGELVKKVDNPYPLNFKSEVDPVYIFKLLKIIKEYKPDIIHSHDSHSLTPCIFASKLNSSFHLVHTRRVDFPLKKKFFNKYKSKKVKLVAISQAVRDIISESGISKDKIELVYSGSEQFKKIDKATIEKFKSLYNPDNKKVIGIVANISDHKDYPTLLKSFEELYKVRQDMLLLIVGDGPLFDEIKNLASTFKSKDSIVFTGFISEIPEMLSMMDIFTMTSKTEGLCTSIIDAMNMSLPTVATRAGGIPELVKDGETGFLCDVGDYKALADAYSKLLENDELRQKMATTAKERAYNFSKERMVESYIELYKRLIR
jgi:glycosyltransferase involved in cell wall biosynthesis